jgi:hypothetical protein
MFACAVSVLFFRYFHCHQFEWKRSEFETVFNYSAWQVISVVSIYIINMGMNYLLVIYQVSLEQIGLYNLAYRLYSGFSPFFSLFGIIIPKWIHSSSESVPSIDKKILKIVFSLAILYMAFGIVLIPLLELFDMERYIKSVPYYFMLFPAFLLMSYVNLLNTVIANTAHFRHAQIGALLQAGTLLISGFLLVSAFEVTGAIGAVTLGNLIGSIYFYRIYRNTLIQMV